MKITFISSLLLLSALIIGCENKTIEVDKPELTGLWQLHSMKVRDTATNTWAHYKGGMDGYLLYDGEENVALHLYEEGYEDLPPKFSNFTDTIDLESLQYITKSYYYMGKYKVSETDSIVSHYKLSHSNPSEFGLTAERRFWFNGDTLVMQPVERKNSRLKLKWFKE